MQIVTFISKPRMAANNFSPCLFIFVFTCLALFPFSSFSQVEEEITPENFPDSLIRRLDESRYSIGNLTLNKETGKIYVPGFINMQKGPVEYLAVAFGGKTHESVLVMDITPLHLQVALLLFGLDYGQNLAFQGDTTLPEGDSVTIYVEWKNDDGDSVSYPASQLIYDVQNDQKVSETKWVFTGSVIFDGKFFADVDGSIVATYSDPIAILNNPLSGRIDDTVYGVNSHIVPQPGKEVLMVIDVLQPHK